MSDPTALSLSALARAVASTPAAGASPAPLQLAAQVSGQIAAAVVQAPGRQSTELVLSPPELGRVAIRFEGERAGGTLVLVIERPETLELMRRHVDTLDQALRHAGHEGCNVAFGGRGGDRSMPAPPNPVAAGAETPRDPAADSPPEHCPAVGAGRLDLRF